MTDAQLADALARWARRGFTGNGYRLGNSLVDLLNLASKRIAPRDAKGDRAERRLERTHGGGR